MISSYPRYTFHTLPAHPLPAHYETLTSYLIRLAEANQFSALDTLTLLLFPRQDRRIMRTYADFPPVDLTDLAITTTCSISQLLETTFYHVGAKFARSFKPQPLSRFLSTTVAGQLRYCPHCVAEKGHYLLIWRFRHLLGCPEHSCKLLDYCGYCGQTIPFLAAPFRIGICPACGCDFTHCVADQLTAADFEMCVRIANDLQFLLTPEKEQVDYFKVVKVVGLRLAHKRLEQCLSINELATAIGVTRNMIEGIERGNSLQRGATFLSYKQYAEFMEVDIRTLFDHGEVTLALYKNRMTELKDEVNRALSLLTELGEKITQDKVAAQLGVAPSTLRQYPIVINLIKRAQVQQVSDNKNRSF